MKKGFTLAEVLITLTVIGIITAVIIPVAVHSKPDENIMKFKKAHNTLFQVISTLTSSDKYYLDGNLGVKADGTILDGTHENDYMYFCKSLTQILSIKSENCSEKLKYADRAHYALFTKTIPTNWEKETNLKVTQNMIDNFKEKIDAECQSDVGKQLKKQIILTDNTEIYETNNLYPFGKKFQGTDSFIYGENKNALIYDINGFGVGYKQICLKINSTSNEENKVGDLDLSQEKNWYYSTKTCDDINDICPFGYGIRADGKILTGKRADEWLKKSLQGEN